MDGLHLTADLYDCQCPAAWLVDAQALAALCNQAVADAGLTRMHDSWVPFPSHNGQPGGVTGVVLLAESHVAIHTWPELGHVTLDVYVCNFSGDNSGKAQQVLDALVGGLQPARCLRQRLQRGSLQAGDEPTAGLAG
ncbi:adenosylmethionine decarboxylase [Comamonas piscis]|uniref:Adenosylmethionine decarboxylase n=1 Tax=Comamonas piscis TaxID=1562974 RepID=A0A7G5EN97_9BURK|nr:adenosylmethionine decarboxylase [Comamonas piscis]QMV75472.1 adenosylmethionine decarboxylase [Comamonas piscis]WSO33981.1 adenosylmethionine decarboxylase [Comamonas piscis]